MLEKVLCRDNGNAFMSNATGCMEAFVGAFVMWRIKEGAIQSASCLIHENPPIHIDTELQTE